VTTNETQTKVSPITTPARTKQVQAWWSEPPDAEVKAALDRLLHTPDVVHVAVMPDVHLAEDVCIGVVLASASTLFPAAVGGDIGCGMATIELGVDAETLDDPRTAARVLDGFANGVPVMRHARRDAPELPAALRDADVGSPELDALRRREGALQLGTLGRGNHFLELQADEDGGLWLVVHSGSRGLGPAIRAAHEAAAHGGGLFGIAAQTPEGAAYLADVQWALAYADASRSHMLEVATGVLRRELGATPREDTLVRCHHNFVRRETHGGRELWVHRKGANAAAEGEPGIIPGSMGTATYHVEGRGCAAALCSSSHGAGRAMSRARARRVIGTRRLHEELRGIWYDHRLASQLCEEAPGAYKDIGAVMRAQGELVKIVRRTRPVLVYKGA
jgi:tRNA-splicing ligase RtcB